MLSKDGKGLRRGINTFSFFLLVGTKILGASTFVTTNKQGVQRWHTMATSSRDDEDGGVHRFLSPFIDRETKTALIILNSPMMKPPSPLFDHLWNVASFRICADGGANRLYESTREKANNEGKKYIPDRIRGDLDSLHQHVRDYYGGLGTLVDKDPDQNTNDLDKALQVVSKEWVKDDKNYRVCVYGAFGGRFDQEMGSMQALYAWGHRFDNQLFLVDDKTCAFLLPPNVRNEIRLSFFGDDPTPNERDSSCVGEGPTCGLIPLGCKCESMVTTGLKWNLNGDTSEFGGLVSTSNRVVEEVATVRASHPLIFTAEISCGKVA